MGDTISQQILLTGEAAKLCKRISGELSRRKNRSISYGYVVSKIISDYVSEGIDTSTRSLRLYYLTLSIKDAMVWGGGITTTIHLKRPVHEFVSQIQKFSRERRKNKTSRGIQQAGMIKVEIMNAMVHDYIACVEITGKDFMDYYVEKSLT